MALVYLHRKKDNLDPFLNVFYVGISKNYRRPTVKYKRNSMWNRIVKKHGYQIEITHQNLCWEFQYNARIVISQKISLSLFFIVSIPTATL